MKAPMTPCVGTMTVKNGHVVWTLLPDEARELADFFEESSTPDDLAREDANALRQAAGAAPVSR